MQTTIETPSLRTRPLLLPYFRLARPANLPTAAADVLAGYCLAGGSAYSTLFLLTLSTICLYAGGVTLNDAADYEIDARERPDRPIPSGAVPVWHAYIQAAMLFGSGIGFATLSGPLGGSLAVAIATLACCYDFFSKTMPLQGFYFMAGCRALNLMLGMSVNPAALSGRWWIAGVHFVYVSALTLVSHGEVKGGRSLHAGLAALAVLGCGFGAWNLGRGESLTSIMLVLFFALTVPGFLAAVSKPQPLRVRGAVKRAVLGIILLDAVFCASASRPFSALICVFYLLLSSVLVRRFEVT